MTSIDSSDRVRSLRAPGYFILAMAVVFPLVELVLSVSPWHPTAVMWRFGVMGLAASAAGTPLTALFFIYALALLAGDRNVVRVVCAVAAVIAVVLILGAGGFVLDVLQMKARVKPEALRQFKYASAQALIKQLFWGVAAGVLAISAFRTVRKTRTQTVRSPNESLLVGRPSRSKSADVTGDVALAAKPVV
jgi:hypothetical protein